MLRANNIYIVNIFQDYIAEHNLLYLLELDGNNKPEELHSVRHQGYDDIHDTVLQKLY